MRVSLADTIQLETANRAVARTASHTQPQLGRQPLRSLPLLEWRQVELLPHIRDFLWNELRLTLHPDKVSLRTPASGVDFLGWVNFPDHRVLRTTTKKRMFRGIKTKEGKEETVQSYFGLMSHGNAKKLRRKIENELKNIA